MTIGLRILPRKRQVSAEVVDKFRTLPVANISDCMWRMTAGGTRLRPMHRGGPMAGPALTVKSRPGDNLMLHKALLLAEAGDVIVCDAGGDLTNSLIGELMIAEAEVSRLGGIVINGAIRDLATIRDGAFPVYAAGVSHRGPYKDGPGEINVPIAIDGMVVEPGDLMVGDDDGLLCVPFEAIDGVYTDTVAKQAAEVETMAAIRAGKNQKSWVDEALKRLGCQGL
ncbi:MAG: RraA family protein [Pseudomonadota bacterium]